MLRRSLTPNSSCGKIYKNQNKGRKVITVVNKTSNRIAIFEEDRCKTTLFKGQRAVFNGKILKFAFDEQKEQEKNDKRETIFLKTVCTICRDFDGEELHVKQKSRKYKNIAEIQYFFIKKKSGERVKAKYCAENEQSARQEFAKLLQIKLQKQKRARRFITAVKDALIYMVFTDILLVLGLIVAWIFLGFIRAIIAFLMVFAAVFTVRVCINIAESKSFERFLELLPKVNMSYSLTDDEFGKMTEALSEICSS
jgi:hypothetical protein